MNDLDQLVDELAAAAAPVKPAPHPYVLSSQLIGAATAYLAISLGVSGLRPDWAHALVQPWFVAEVVTLFLIFVCASLSAVVLSFPDLHQKRPLIFAPVAPCVLFVIVMFLAWHADNPPAPLPAHTFECTSCIFLVAILPTAWNFFVMRRLASTRQYAAGAAAALAAFSIGALWLRLHEINDSIVHVVEWHYLPMLAAGILGLLVGRRVLAW